MAQFRQSAAVRFTLGRIQVPGRKAYDVRRTLSRNGWGVMGRYQGEQRRGRQRSGRARRCFGVAAVELALCLPFLITLALGAIETCNVVHVRTRMYSAAFEAARLATRPVTATKVAATDSDVTTRCSNLLSQLGVRGGQPQVAVRDSTGVSKTLSTANAQDLVTVSITAPLAQNSITAFVLSNTMTISAQATLIVE